MGSYMDNTDKKRFVLYSIGAVKYLIRQSSALFCQASHSGRGIIKNFASSLFPVGGIQLPVLQRYPDIVIDPPPGRPPGAAASILLGATPVSA